MKQGRKHRLVIAGSGGRGILMMGKLLAEAGASMYKHVTYFPSYSAEMRGGDSEATVILSDEDIRFQAVLNPEEVIVMALPFLKPMEARIKPGGIMIVDNSVIPNKVERDDITVHYLPATRKALEVGNTQVANLVVLGSYLEATGVMPLEAIEQALDKRMLGTKREALLSLNKEALRAGARLIPGYKG